VEKFVAAFDRLMVSLKEKQAASKATGVVAGKDI